MNILLINHYAGSPELGMEFRPYYLAKEWIKLGHSVFIVSADFSHVRSRQPNVESDFQLDEVDGINYLWLKTNKYKSSGIKRILNIILFVFKLFLYSRRIIKSVDPDLVIASSTYPLDIYPARLISRRNNASLIFEVHDLWPLSPIELGGYSRYHPFILTMQLAENYAYKVCDKVVSILPCAKQHMVSHGLSDHKFFHIPNGIVTEDWEFVKELPKIHQTLIDDIKKAGNFTIGYAGAHGIANSLDSVINAVAELSDHRICLFLLGTGQEKERLKAHVKEKGIRNVFFLDPLEKASVPAFLKQMDVLFIGLQKQPLFRFGISPNKMFDYMMAGKPVIQAIESGNNIVEEADCGLVAEPENVEDIKEAILKIYTSSRVEREMYGRNGISFVKRNHTYDVLAEKFIQV